jgi:hypothetical protein
MDILLKQFWNHFTQEFTRKNVGTQSEQPGLNSYCKNLSVWTHSVGKKVHFVSVDVFSMEFGMVGLTTSTRINIEGTPGTERVPEKATAGI